MKNHNKLNNYCVFKCECFLSNERGDFEVGSGIVQRVIGECMLKGKGKKELGKLVILDISYVRCT